MTRFAPYIYSLALTAFDVKKEGDRRRDLGVAPVRLELTTSKVCSCGRKQIPPDSLCSSVGMTMFDLGWGLAARLGEIRGQTGRSPSVIQPECLPHMIFRKVVRT